jgi:hypothetical protein
MMDREETQNASDLHAAVAEARLLAREQVAAAWQLHLDRIREELESGWRERLDSIFDERFSEVEARLADGFHQAVQSGIAQSRLEVTAGLNETARRLRAAETRAEWIRTFTEAASRYCRRVAVLAVTSKGLSLGEHPEVPVASAPAFATAIESLDTVVAVGSPRELSQTLSSVLGDASAQKVYLFPVVVRHKAVAVVYAEPGDTAVDVGALELLTAIAAASIEASQTVVVSSPGADLVRISAAAAAAPVSGPSWADLPKQEQELHLRAQRFARTRVAEMLLHRVRQVRAGRDAKNLYDVLREEIDAAREAFRQEFIETCPSMVDYLHLEMQRTLAKDDAGALGDSYPGPLAAGAASAGR